MAQKNDVVHAEKQEARKHALQLRMRGTTYPQIGATLGVSATTAFKYVRDALAEIPREDAIALKKVELAKLDRREFHTNHRLENDAISITDFAKLQLVLTRITEQRSKLEGLYAPVGHEVTFPDIDVKSLTHEQKVRLVNGDVSVVQESTAAGGGVYRPGANGAGSNGGASPH